MDEASSRNATAKSVSVQIRLLAIKKFAGDVPQLAMGLYPIPLSMGHPSPLSEEKHCLKVWKWQCITERDHSKANQRLSGRKMGEVSYHVRLVILGGGGVGKTAIVKRFLFNTFCEKHRPTVEDLFFKEFNLGTMILKVDFLDTAGDLQFPAMRRLSITNAQAFLLVYAIDDQNSFTTVQQCFEEIREVKSDYQEIPMIFVGNKTDNADKRVVNKEDVAEWVFCDLPKLRAKVMECSAKTDTNIKEVFKAFTQLAKIPLPTDDCGLRRRSSAHSSVPKHKPNTLSPHPNTPETLSPTSSLGQRLKPRSRSLIRRTSKKVNKVKDPNSEPDDCFIS